MNLIGIWIIRHSLWVTAVFVAIFVWYWLLKNQKKLKLDGKYALLVAICHVAAAAATTKLMGFIENPDRMIFKAPFRIYGAVFLVPLLYYFVAKLSNRKVTVALDIAAVNMIISNLLAKFNCMVAGCCEGALITSDGTLRWPIRQLEALYCIIFMVIFCKRIMKGRTWGQVYPIYMISYGSFRLILDWMLDKHTHFAGAIHFTHLWSVIAIAAGAIMLYRADKQHKRKKQVINKKYERRRK